MRTSDPKTRKEILNLVVQEYYRPMSPSQPPHDPSENKLDDYDEDDMLFLARKDIDTFCKFAKKSLVAAAYKRRLQKIQFSRSENWNTSWSRNLLSWMSQVVVISVDDLPNTRVDAALQILPAVKLYISYSKKCWMVFGEHGYLFDTRCPRNGCLEELKKLYHLFPPKYSAPFNIWLEVIRQLFQTFHFELPVEEIYLDQNWELMNAWHARPIDFHPANHRRLESLGEDSQWINLKWSAPIIDQKTVRQVYDTINSDIILHTTALGLTRCGASEWIGYEWKIFGNGLKFYLFSNTGGVSCHFNDDIIQSKLLLQARCLSSLSIKCEDLELYKTTLCETSEISSPWMKDWKKYQDRLSTSRATPSFISLAPMDKMLFFVGWTMLTAIELHFSCFSKLFGCLEKISTLEEEVFNCTTLASKCKERKEVEIFISFYLPKELAVLIVQYSHCLDSPPSPEEFLRTIKHLC